MGDTRARVCCGTACSRVTQELEAAAMCIQMYWWHYRFDLKRDGEVLDFFEYEERVCGVNSELGRAKALVAASKNFDAVYGAAYAEQVAYAKYLLKHTQIRQSATRIQACWRGWLGRDDYQAAKQAKAKKERAKRAEAKREAKAMQLSFSERPEAAAPPDKSAGQLVVGNTILGHSIANDESLCGPSAASAAASGCSRASCRRASGAV